MPLCSGAVNTLRVERDGPVLRVTMARPEVRNAFDAALIAELTEAFADVGDARAVVLAGEGKSFSAGADVEWMRSSVELSFEENVEDALRLRRMLEAIDGCPAPVIARVQGYAIGGGNVLCTICDLTICSDKAIFGQVGPKMGSVDPGYGTAFLARVVGEKKAREIWYLNRRYSGAEAVAMGLANVCVPHEQLDAEVQKWAEEICERSPTAIAIAKRSFNMDTAHQSGIAGMGMYALKLYYDTEESREGVSALKEKRKPDFRKYAK